MTAVTQLLDDIQERLTLLRRPVVADLERPGLPEDELRRMLGDVPDEVRDWFSWCNGTRRRAGQTVGDAAFIPGYIFPSASEARGVRRPGHRDLDAMGEWLPILLSASSDLYAAVWKGSAFVGVAGVLQGAETEIEFLTVEEMLRVQLAAFGSGAYFLDEGELEVDDDLLDDAYRQVTGREPLD
ncbi:hypothetical protein FE633_16635 [Streptomyces montanus]|uniref:SMI1/KNR4 family protein n=1 Tax=Streptomyces montanus TaxID=2580423 RepID=A0A5R9G0B5_9ACTN|nr:hypothetical protein [Streptomyces montanus]TLS45075.1 hypothetical protein FE633_16635 [Streptomyces montanus]